MDKIDTQGLSGPAIKGCTDNVYPHDENGEPILPRAVIQPRRVHTPDMVKELKILINEGLDAREDTYLLLLFPHSLHQTKNQLPYQSSVNEVLI